MRVLASDGGFPSLTDTTVVYVNVTRNLFSPVFQPDNYNIAIPESEPLGETIITVTALDSDATVRNNLQFAYLNTLKYIAVLLFSTKIMMRTCNYIFCVWKSQFFAFLFMKYHRLYVFCNSEFWFQSPNNVVEYTLAGNTQALNYFRVDSRSGQISLIRPVSADTTSPNSYTVSGQGQT